MALENKSGITDAVEPARAGERISKTKAKKLFESGALDSLNAGSFRGEGFHLEMDGLR